MEEDNNFCVIDDLDCLVNDDDQKNQEKSKVLSFNNDRSVALIDLLPSPLSEESFCVMVEKEKDFLPENDYLMRLRSGDLDLNVRTEAVNWIWKVNYMFFLFLFLLLLNFLIFLKMLVLVLINFFNVNWIWKVNYMFFFCCKFLPFLKMLVLV